MPRLTAIGFGATLALLARALLRGAIPPADAWALIAAGALLVVGCVGLWVTPAHRGGCGRGDRSSRAGVPE